MRKGRKNDELRKLRIKRSFTASAYSSVLIEIGNNKVLATASIVDSVPPFLRNTTQGWLTAEYNMLPGSTSQRKPRMRLSKVDGRTLEIQRLIGRSLRSAIDLAKIGSRTIWLDCDVLEADGGTRTTSINGAFVALKSCVKRLLKEKLIKENPILFDIAAVSVGVVDGEAMLDLNYEEDFRTDVDMNVVMNDAGKIIELQGTAEKAPFSTTQLSKLIKLAKKGITEIIAKYPKR